MHRHVLVALVLSFLAVVGVVGTAAPAQAARPDAEQLMVNHINGARAAAGLGSLSPNLRAARVAREWSAAMQARGRLEHNPNLTAQVAGPWRHLGENVGRNRVHGASTGQLVDRLHVAFMNSSGHRANVLKATYNQVGVGVSEASDGTMWMTVVFVAGPQGAFPLFADAAGSTHEPSIARIWQAGITTGCAPGSYCPVSAVSRAQMATFLARAMPLAPKGGNSFKDVSGVHAGSINSLAATGISDGCGKDRFCPDDPLTRGQMATFLARALDLKDAGGTRFRDVGKNSDHAGAIAALADAGITKGCGGGRFCPGQALSRAEMASFLSRAMDHGWR